jgi:hypothetical protein
LRRARIRNVTPRAGDLLAARSRVAGCAAGAARSGTFRDLSLLANPRRQARLRAPPPLDRVAAGLSWDARAGAGGERA